MESILFFIFFSFFQPNLPFFPKFLFANENQSEINKNHTKKNLFLTRSMTIIRLCYWFSIIKFWMAKLDSFHFERDKLIKSFFLFRKQRKNSNNNRRYLFPVIYIFIFYRQKVVSWIDLCCNQFKVRPISLYIYLFMN